MFHSNRTKRKNGNRLIPVEKLNFHKVIDCSKQPQQKPPSPSKPTPYNSRKLTIDEKTGFWSNLNDKIQILAVKKLIINWKFSCSAYKTGRKLLSDGEYCADNLNHVFDTDISYGKNSECRLDHRKVKFLNCCEKFQPYKIWLKFFRSKTGRISKVISERSRWNQIKLNDHHVINNLFYLLVCLVILDDL